MKFGKVNKDANLRSSMFSNSSHKQNIRDSMSMSKGGFIPKYEQQDEMNKSLRSQNTMHNEISQIFSQSSGTDIEIATLNEANDVERCKSYVKESQEADFSIKMPLQRRKSLEIESPSSPNRKTDDFMNEGGEERLESQMDLDQPENQLLGIKKEVKYERIPIMKLNQKLF